MLVSHTPKPEAISDITPVLAHCQLAKNPLCAAEYSAKKAVALPNSPPTEKPCSRRARRTNSGAASPIVA
jgi:hypothetical protein